MNAGSAKDVGTNKLISCINQYRPELMAIAAISIFFMHVVQTGLLSCTRPIYKIFELWGTFGTDVFCILSGLGIFYSLRKMSNIKEWIQRRVKRVYIPYLIIAIAFNAAIINKSILSWLLKLTTLQYWIIENDGGWYVSFILFMYIAHLILFTVKKDRVDIRLVYTSVSILLLLGILMDYVSHPIYERYVHFFHSLPAYIVGICLGYNGSKTDTHKFHIAPLIMALVSLISVFLRSRLSLISLSLTGIYKLGMSVFFVCLVPLIMSKVKDKYCVSIVQSFRKGLTTQPEYPKEVNLLRLLGGGSLEFYLIHVYLIKIIEHYEIKSMFKENNILWVGLLFISLVLAALIRKICKRYLN